MKVLRSVVSDTKEEVVHGMEYIGTGSYRDEEENVWDLERQGTDWVIRRVADLQARRPETAEEYWAKLLPSEMVDALFRRTVTMKGIVEDKRSGVPPCVTVYMEVDQPPKPLLLTIQDGEGEAVVSVVSSGEEEWKGRTASLPLIDRKISTNTSLYGDIACTDSFATFVALQLLS